VLTKVLLPEDGVRYLGIFFLTMGVHCNVPALLAFNQSNTLGAANRAISSGILIACGAIGGIIGSLIFRAEVCFSISKLLQVVLKCPQDAPGYGPGIYTTMGFCIYNFFALVVLIFVFGAKNKRLASGEVVDGAPEGYKFSL
jgi:hypothetical protein